MRPKPLAVSCRRAAAGTPVYAEQIARARVMGQRARPSTHSAGGTMSFCSRRSRRHARRRVASSSTARSTRRSSRQRTRADRRGRRAYRDDARTGRRVADRSLGSRAGSSPGYAHAGARTSAGTGRPLRRVPEFLPIKHLLAGCGLSNEAISKGTAIPRSSGPRTPGSPEPKSKRVVIPAHRPGNDRSQFCKLPGIRHGLGGAGPVLHPVCL